MSYDTTARINFTINKTKRSEEHTSELQSRQYLVCRLLLEKKNTHKADLRQIWTAPERAIREPALDTLAEKCAAKYGRPVAYLANDSAALLRYYDFPHEHWA